jgi:hypothetical protein
MADVDATNNGDVATLEKRDKPESSVATDVSSSTPTKHLPSRPLGSKNKKPSMTMTDPADCLDVSVAHPIMSSSL